MTATNASVSLPKKLKLTYFDIQGVGEKVRLALNLGRIPFEDHRVAFAEWGELKPTTPYGQLPLLTIDDGEPMAQSDAMLRYAGRLADTQGVALYPEAKALEVDEAMGLVGDVQTQWRLPVYIGMTPDKFGYDAEGFKGSEDHAAVVKKVRGAFMATEFPKLMGILTKRLEKTGAFLVPGLEGPTIADCELVPTLNRFTSGGVDTIPTDCLDAYPVVKEYVARFMALPEVAAYYAAREAATAAAAAK